MLGFGLAQNPPRIKVHGHRGARAIFPENTLPAFQYAIREGADSIELDVHATKDDVLVVSHDPTLDAPICSGPRPKAVIREMTLADLKPWDCGAIRNPAFPKQQTVPGTRLPTLDEVFDLAPQGRFDFIVEAKLYADRPQLTPAPEPFAAMVLASIRKHNLESRVVFQSFDFRILHAMKKLAPALRMAALYGGAPMSLVEIGEEAGTRIVNPVSTVVTPERVKEAHAAGFEVNPWTVNTPAEWDRMIAAGVDGIITDDPAGLIGHLKR